MAGEAYYNTGTATVAANSKTVTGTGTNWLSAVGGLTAIKAGDKFGIHVGRPIIIASVDSNTQLTLEDNWPGPAQTNAAYRIELTSPDIIAVEAMRRMLGSLSSGVLYGLSQLPLSPSTALTIDENGAAALADLSPLGKSLIAALNSSAAYGVLGEIPNAQLPARLRYNPVQQGGGTNQLDNKIRIGWSVANKLRVQVDESDFGKDWPIDIAGNALTVGGVHPQLSPSDRTPGRILTVGAFGLGGQPILLDSGSNLNSGITSGMYRWATSRPANAPDSDYCTMLSFDWEPNSPVVQVAFHSGSSQVFRRSRAGTTWSAWNRIDGDVSGPAVAIDNAPVGFSGTSGKSIKQLTGPVAALHAVTGAENKLAYFTGAAAMATTDLTAFARTILDDTTGAQMFATMGATFSGTSAAGSAKLPSGLELKWGTSVNSLSDFRQLFPIAFANDCFVALPVNTFGYDGATDRFIGASISNVDKNGFDIRARNITNGGGVAGQGNAPILWLAVGW